MSGSIKSACSLLLILTVSGVPPTWAAEARLLTQADIDGMGGPIFQGGVGDYLLANDSIQAVVLAVGTTPDGVESTDSPMSLGSYFSSGLAPTGGVLIDAMTTGDANDQLQTIAHNVNLLTATGGFILYRGPEANPPGSPVFSAPVLISGPTASITVTGALFFPATPLQMLGPPGSISSVTNPTVTATTTYSLTDSEQWIEITTTITNNGTDPVPVFTVGDENRYVRNQLTFQPFPFRGEYAPTNGFANPTSGIGVMPWYAFIGLLDDSLAPLDAVEPICYALVSPDLATPAVAHEAQFRRNVFTRKYATDMSLPTLAGGASMIFDRKLVVAKGGSVEDCADIINPLLYEPVNRGDDLRATFEGRVITPTGEPIPNATILIDNEDPGFPEDMELNALSTAIDLDFDGQLDDEEPAIAGSAVPATHARTDAKGRFTVKLQAVAALPSATKYGGTIYAANRLPVALPEMTVEASTIATGVDLGDFEMSSTGTAEITVTDGGTPTPAQLCIFGTGTTASPDFGDQLITRSRFDGLQQGDDLPGETLTRGNSGRLSEAKREFPAVNCDVATDGLFSLELAPGTYDAYASRGPNYDFDVESFTITAEATTVVPEMNITQVVPTFGWSSVDSHVHAAPSNDAGVPVTDRVLSMLGTGVDIIIATEHDQMADFQPQIEALGIGGEIRSVIGIESSGEALVPGSMTYTDGTNPYPRSVGHIIAFPLSIIEGNRRRGAPTDEEILAATVFDRLRGMDSLPLLGATPDTATEAQWLAAIQAGQPGTPGAALPPDEDIIIYAHPRGSQTLGPYRNFPGGGFDPAADIHTFPNNQANLRSNYHRDHVGPDGTLTRGIENGFDAFEMLNSSVIEWYLLTRADWFSLLDQGIHKAVVAGSDTHRAVIDGPGYPRFYVPCDPCTDDELVDHVRDRRAFGTNGIFLRFGLLSSSISTGTLFPVIMGSTVTDTFPILFFILDVRAAPWVPVEEIRIFQNGDTIYPIDLASGTGGIGGPVQRFFGIVAILGPATDSYFMVEAGSEIHPLPAGGPYPSEPAINPDTLVDMRKLTTSDMVSLAYTNPIFVDRNGDGYNPPGLRPATKADYARARFSEETRDEIKGTELQ